MKAVILAGGHRCAKVCQTKADITIGGQPTCPYIANLCRA